MTKSKEQLDKEIKKAANIYMYDGEWHIYEDGAREFYSRGFEDGKAEGWREAVAYLTYVTGLGNEYLVDVLNTKGIEKGYQPYKLQSTNKED